MEGPMALAAYVPEDGLVGGVVSPAQILVLERKDLDLVKPCSSKALTTEPFTQGNLQCVSGLEFT